MRLFFFSVILSLAFLTSCDSNSTVNKKSANTTEQPSNPVSKANKGESKIPAPQQPQRSALVESEVQVAEQPVADQGVDYTAFAKAVCACGERSNTLNNQMRAYSESGNSQAFTEMVPKVKEAYDRSVACSKGHAEALKSEYSMQKLVSSLKSNCGDYDDKLIWQIFLALKKS